MMRLMLDQSACGEWTVHKVGPKVNDQGEQKKNFDGVPQWSVFSIVDPPQGDRKFVPKPDGVEVVIASAKAPDIVKGAVPVFHGLAVRPWSMVDYEKRRDSEGVTFSASGVEAAKPVPAVRPVAQ